MGSQITPRERVLTALNHKIPDRIPLMIGADLTTSVLSGAYHALANYLEIAPMTSWFYGWPELDAVIPTEAILRQLGSDVRSVTDIPGNWGIRLKRIPAGGCDVVEHPLVQITTPDEITSYEHWPNKNTPEQYTSISRQATMLADANEFAVVGAPYMIAPFERASMLVGRVQLLKMLLRQPDLAHMLLEHVTRHLETQLRHFLTACGDRLDLIVIGDDLGVQDGPLMAPRIYRTFLKPLHARLIALIRTLGSARVMFHTDGDVTTFLDDLVEIGVDILNPIEPFAGEMADLSRLKRRYGDHLCFCGGIDTLRILPCGTPDDVRREVTRVIKTLGPAGFLAAPTHALMASVPPENIVAFATAVTESGKLLTSQAR